MPRRRRELRLLLRRVRTTEGGVGGGVWLFILLYAVVSPDEDSLFLGSPLCVPTAVVPGTVTMHNLIGSHRESFEPTDKRKRDGGVALRNHGDVAK
jgi:hypothetical protein